MDQRSKHQQELNIGLNRLHCMNYCPAAEVEDQLCVHGNIPSQQSSVDITKHMKLLTRPSQHDKGAAGS